MYNLLDKHERFCCPRYLSYKTSKELLDFQSLKDEYVYRGYPTSPYSSAPESRFCHMIYLYARVGKIQGEGARLPKLLHYLKY